MDIHKETFSLCCFTNAKEQVEYPQKIAGHYAPTERNAPASSSTARTILFRIAQTKTLPVLSGIAVDPFSLGNESPYDTVVPLVRTLLTGRVRVSEVHQRICQFLQFREPGEFRSVIRGNSLEHFREVLAILHTDLLEGLHDGSGFLARQRNHPILTAHALRQSQEDFVVTSLLADHEVAFPMTELSALIDARVSLLNAASKHLLVLTVTMMLSPAGEFLWQLMVPGLHQPKIHVVVQCLGAGDLFPSELTALERPPLADIQRPAIFTHMPINVGDESVFSQAIIVTAAVAAVLLIGLLTLIRLVSLHMPIVQVDRAAPQLIAHRIRSAADLSSDTVWGAALFVAYLDDHSFIIRKMLALYMLFCGRMYLIHSDPPLEIVLLALTFYQKRHAMDFLFNCSTSFYNQPK